MVRGRPTSPKIGIFQAGSHRIADIPACRIHHPRVNEVAAALRTAIRATGTPPYADRPHAGRLRAVQVVVERNTSTVQVVVVANDRTPGPSQELIEALGEALGERLHSLWWNGNPERTNVILGALWHHVRGPAAVRERIGGADVFFPPGAFGQSHLDLADRLVERVHAWVPDGARVAELYAGCGGIGLGLLGRVSHLVFNESQPHAVEGLARGIAARPEADRRRAQVAAGPAQEQLALLDSADVVIVDPPRRGLDAPVLEALCRRPPERLVYVSCGLASFLRDADALRARGGRRLRCLEAFALFPYTEHVEVLAVFA
jgi:23S rRNA (uracil1939-C5)-methyltransferase